jgi:mannosyltransferase PIG-V
MATQPYLMTQTEPASVPRWRVDLRSVGGAALAVLLLRVVLQVVALAVSAYSPQTAFERRVAVLPGGAPLGQWLQRVTVMPWMRYDANWYQRIVEHGYRPNEGTAAFHPLYPLLAAPIARLLGDHLGLALLLISTLASVALCVLFTRYVAQVYGSELAQPAGWLLLVGPPAFVLLAPYSESTFLALAMAALFALQRERWWWAGLLGGLAALTRQQGLALALPLAWALLLAVRERRARIWHGAALLLVPLGYGLVVAYRALAFNELSVLAHTRGPADFLYTLLVSPAAETVAAGQRIAWPWETFVAELHLIITSANNYYMLIDLVLGWAAVLIVLVGLRWMNRLDRLYAIGVVALALCYYNGDLSPYMALPRHVMLAFPLWIVLARWAGRGLRLFAIVEIGLLINLFLAGAFVYQGWIP